MCLNLITKDYCIAREDIIVYKVLEKCYDGYLSPYRRVLVDITKGQQATIEEEPNLIIEVGIHCFTHSYLAMAIANSCCDNKGKVFRCYIPKGTKYYIGSDNDIVCEDLRYMEEIYVIEGLKAFDCIINRKCRTKENKVNFLSQSDKDLKVGETYCREFTGVSYAFGATRNYVLATGFSIKENTPEIKECLGYNYVVEIPEYSTVIINNRSNRIIFSDTIKVIEKCV